MMDEGILANDSPEVRRLVDAAAGGDTAAFDRLVLAYQERVFNMAFRYTGNRDDAADIAQDAFVNAYKAIPRFKHDANFYTWLCKITINLCLSRGRSISRKGKTFSISAEPDEDGATKDIPDTAHGPSEAASSNERAEIMQKAISTLEEEYRSAIILVDINGLSYEEAAETLDAPIGTVRSRLHNGRCQLKEKLKRMNFFPPSASKGA